MAVMVSMEPPDSQIHVAARPAVRLPFMENERVMTFAVTTNFQLDGFVTLQGGGDDSARGWTAGFIQAEWVETNWCSYRGASDHDGSVLIQRGRQPARAQKACRDTFEDNPVQDVFYDARPGYPGIAAGLENAAFPQILRVKFLDGPSERHNLVVQNTVTGKPNFLYEAQCEFLFCTLLSVRDPAGNFSHHKGVYWNVRWQYRFLQPDFRPIVDHANTGVTIGTQFVPDHIDPRFAGVLTSPTELKSCNILANEARSAAYRRGSPNRHESPVWTNFGVTAR